LLETETETDFTLLENRRVGNRPMNPLDYQLERFTIRLSVIIDRTPESHFGVTLVTWSR
jgi:hypothetical protein